MKNKGYWDIKTHLLIYLKGVYQQELVSILQFMYFGKAAVNENRIIQVLNNARELQKKQLVDNI